jgi:hypothetical protein
MYKAIITFFTNTSTFGEAASLAKNWSFSSSAIFRPEFMNPNAFFVPLQARVDNNFAL